MEKKSHGDRQETSPPLMAAPAPLKLSEFDPSVGATKLLPLPARLAQLWTKDFVQTHQLKLLENRGGGYCGHYVLGQMENALLGARPVTPHDVIDRLQTLAAFYTPDRAVVQQYFERPHHLLQDYELAWYLNWLKVNWVLIHYRHGAHSAHQYTAEVQSDPTRPWWVFLFNKGLGHWVIVVQTTGRGTHRRCQPVFTAAQATHLLHALGVPLPHEDTRVLMPPQDDDRDYDLIKAEHRLSRRKKKADEADYESDATLADDPYA